MIEVHSISTTIVRAVCTGKAATLRMLIGWIIYILFALAVQAG